MDSFILKRPRFLMVQATTWVVHWWCLASLYRPTLLGHPLNDGLGWREMPPTMAFFINLKSIWIPLVNCTVHLNRSWFGSNESHLSLMADCWVILATSKWDDRPVSDWMWRLWRFPDARKTRNGIHQHHLMNIKLDMNEQWKALFHPVSRMLFQNPKLGPLVLKSYHHWPLTLTKSRLVNQPPPPGLIRPY